MSTPTRKHSRRVRAIAKPRQQKLPSPPAKITAPSTPHAYRRTRLFRLLDQARRQYRVTWIAAPGGAGKTTLVVSYLESRGFKAIWYQLDTGDRDLASFFHYLGLAVAHRAPRFRQPLPKFTPEYLGGVNVFARNFFRELSRRLPTPFVLVLDNVQKLSADERFHEMLSEGLSELPRGAHAMLLSRGEPPGLFARLRANRQMAEVGWNDMRLVEAELRPLLRVLGPSVRRMPRAEIETLHRHCDGWIAGLILLLSATERDSKAIELSAPVAGQKLFDYFAAEVFARRPPGEQEFLTLTALFPSFTVNMAERITGYARARTLLGDLVRQHHFTDWRTEPADTYQYHPLFREFLLNAAERRYGAQELDQLRERAAELLCESGYINDAADLLIQIGAPASLKKLILQQASTQLAHGRWYTLSQWIAALPDDEFDRDPWLLFWRACATMPRDLFLARQDYHRAYLLFKDQGDAAGLYLAWSGAVDSFTYVWVDFAPLDYWIEEMEALRPQFPEFPSLEIEARVTCGMISAAIWRRAETPMMRHWYAAGVSLLEKQIDPTVKLMIGYLTLFYHLWWRGDLSNAQLLFRKLRALGEDPHIGILARLMWKVMDAAYHYMHGNAEMAVAAAHQGLDLAARSGVHHLDLLLYAQATYGHLTHFDAESANQELRRMESALPSTSSTFDAAHYHYLMAWTLLGQERPASALEQIRIGMEVADRVGTPVYPAFARITYAQALYECGRTAEAFAALETPRQWGGRVGNTYIDVQYQLMKALCALDEHDIDACNAGLTGALRLCKDHEYPSFPWFGWRKPLLARVLRQALVSEIEPGYAREFIRRNKLSPPRDGFVPDTWPFPMKIYALGRFTVLISDMPLRFSGKAQKKPLELLKALIALGGRNVREEKIAEILWPDAEADSAAFALTTTLHRLRRLIGDTAIERREGCLSLDPRQSWVDVWAIERELATIERVSRESIPEEVTEHTEQLFVLYRAPFLADHREESWVLSVRERLRGKFLRVVGLAANALLSARRFEEAIACLEKGLEVDPLVENFYRSMMRTHLARGHHADALATYQRCRQALATNLGLSPSADTEALRRQIPSS